MTRATFSHFYFRQSLNKNSFPNMGSSDLRPERRDSSRTSQRAPCSTSTRSGQTGLVAGQTDFAGEPDEDPTNARLGGTPSGQAHFGCPRLGRPARAPPHAMETRDEQHIGLEEKVKR